MASLRKLLEAGAALSADWAVAGLNPVDCRRILALLAAVKAFQGAGKGAAPILAERGAASPAFRSMADQIAAA